jgi:dephospho-CoA kinase
MIIGLTGPIRSGKDTVAKYLVEKYRFKHLDFYADVIVEQLKKAKKQVTKANASKLGDSLRKKHGRGVMAKLLIEKIDQPRVVVSGFRSPEEVEEFKKRAPDFHLILVDASEEVRFSRRGPKDPKGKTAFFKRDREDEKKGVQEVFLMADHVVENNGTAAEVREKVDRVMAEITSEG